MKRTLEIAEAEAACRSAMAQIEIAQAALQNMMRGLEGHIGEEADALSERCRLALLDAWQLVSVVPVYLGADPLSSVAGEVIDLADVLSNSLRDHEKPGPANDAEVSS